MTQDRPLTYSADDAHHVASGLSRAAYAASERDLHATALHMHRLAARAWLATGADDGKHHAAWHHEEYQRHLDVVLA